MKVCIVGGTGNISTSIVRELLVLGHEVVCYNRGQSASPPSDVRVIKGDRQNREEFEQAMQAEAFDVAIDMISFTREDAASSLRAFRGVGHFIHCSTVCTYGIDSDWMPVTEDHPLRPVSDYGRNKIAADSLLMEAYYREGFPVTIIKPSTTYGPQMGLIRQVAWEFSWIDRVRKGKSIIVCGDGNAIHQFLHVDDAGRAFALMLGRKCCKGQTYNLVRSGFTEWRDHHRTAMRVIGREVELIGVPLANIVAANVPNSSICSDIFAHNTCYSNAKFLRDVPEFHPTVTMEAGMTQILEAMDREGRVSAAETDGWEDRLITAQRAVGAAVISGS